VFHYTVDDFLLKILLPDHYDLHEMFTMIN
jgi:hypothetical protein